MSESTVLNYTSPVNHEEIVVGSKGADYVSIRVTGPSPGGLWTRAEIKIRCDGWSGSANWSFYKGELRAFADAIRRLHRDLSGTAQLQPMEPNITLSLNGDGKGHMNAEGEARNNLSSGTALAFSFSIDQTYLMEIADRLTGPIRRKSHNGR